VDFWPLYNCEQTPYNDGMVVDETVVHRVGRRSDDGEGKFYTSDINAAEKIAGVFF